MKGFINRTRARAESASWPQFAGIFQEEKAKVEEGKQKKKEWPKRGKEGERAKKARQRAKLKKKQPAKHQAKQAAEASKKEKARQTESQLLHGARASTTWKRGRGAWLPRRRWSKGARPVRGRAIQRFRCTTLEAVLTAHPQINCMKIDIEGAELDMLKDLDWIQCLTLEYSFSVDPRVGTLKRATQRLRRL